MPEKKAIKFYRIGEKCPESGLYEHFCKVRVKKLGFRCPKLILFRLAELAVQLNGYWLWQLKRLLITVFYLSDQF
jgi:hypothetical protein